MVPGRQVPFLVREGLGPHGPYSNYAYGSEVAGCRSTLSMSKIKVRISETKYRSFYKTLVLLLFEVARDKKCYWYLEQCIAMFVMSCGELCYITFLQTLVM